MLDYYMPQMQFYMYISGLSQMVFSVIFGNKHECVVVSANKDYRNDMLDKIKAFWEYVTHNERPEDMLIKTKQSIKDNVAINGKVKRDASSSNSFTVAVNQYLHNEDAAKEFEQAKKDIKADLNAFKRRGRYKHGYVHSGFQGELDKIWDELDTELSVLEDRNIHVTGHSLGGAMATLAAKRISEEYDNVH